MWTDMPLKFRSLPLTKVEIQAWGGIRRKILAYVFNTFQNLPVRGETLSAHRTQSLRLIKLIFPMIPHT